MPAVPALEYPTDPVGSTVTHVKGFFACYACDLIDFWNARDEFAADRMNRKARRARFSRELLKGSKRLLVLLN